MTYPLFSVSMCVYEKDNPVWFQNAVESVLNQSVKPSEIVLVVDGAVPSELDAVISKYEHNDIFNVIRFAKNQGHGNARRAGLDACKNELVALMDADDISVETRFEQQLRMFKNSNADIIGGDIIEFIDSEEHPIAHRNVPVTDEKIKQYMKKRCPFNQITVMFRKSAVQKAGGYIDWYCDEDYYLWVRMAQNNCIMANTGTVLAHVRVGKDMYSRRGGKKYFASEVRLQKYMLNNKIIRFDTYIINILKRFIVQMVLPDRLRGWVFRKFARKPVK